MFLVDSLVKTRNSWSERIAWKGETNQKEEWGIRKAAAGRGKKAGRGGNLSNSDQLT